MALQQVHVRQLTCVDGDALALHLDQDRLARLPKLGLDRVPGEAVQNVEYGVGDEVDRLDQEVPTAHGGVENSKLEQLVDNGAPLRLCGDLLWVVARHSLLPEGGLALLGLAVCLLRFAELRPHSLQVLPQHWPDR